MISADDWRQMGQERYLRAVRLTWKRYQARRPEWEHEHCEFCFQKFLDAGSSAAARRALQDDPEHNDPAGYTNLPAAGAPSGEWWICRRCFDDFAGEFGWKVVDSDPEAWPYEGPAPHQRSG